MYQRLRHRTTRMSASLHPMWRPYLLNNKWPKLDNFNTLLRVPNNLQEAYAFILWDIEYHASKDEMIHISTYLTIFCSNTPGSTQKTRIQNEECLKSIYHRSIPSSIAFKLHMKERSALQTDRNERKRECSRNWKTSGYMHITVGMFLLAHCMLLYYRKRGSLTRLFQDYHKDIVSIHLWKSKNYTVILGIQKIKR